MTSNSNLPTATWTVGLRLDGTTIALSVPRDITVEELLKRISATTTVSARSLRVLCWGVLIKATAGVENAVALETYSVLKDGVTVQIMGDPELPVVTRDLWREVGTGLRTSQTIVWNKSVESLAAAKQYFPDNEARNFVNTHLCDIVAIMTAQNPARIGSRERTCVQESLMLAAEIVTMDLQIQSSGHVLDSLGYLFDPKQKYFEEMAKRGGSQATVSGIANRFSKLDGFINLATCMAGKIGTSGFPNPRVVAQVVDLLPLGTSGPDTEVQSLQDKAAATVIVKASIDHISSCNEDYLREVAGNVSVESLRQALLQAVRNKAIATDCDESELWDLWSSLVLRMIDAEMSVAVRKSGWGAWHDLMKWSAEAIHRNERLIVNGAGCSFVNGLYTPAAKIHGEPAYTRIVPDGFGEASGMTITCFRCLMRSRQRWWFISKVDEEQPGTDRDVDYYQNKNGGDCPRLDGWIACRHEGVEPTPTVELACKLGLPEEQTRESPPFKFCHWVQENGLLAKAELDEAYSEYVFEAEKPKTMYDLLSLLRYGLSEEARSFGLQAEVRFEELHREMSNCKTKTDEALKVIKSSTSPTTFETAVSKLEQIMKNIIVYKRYNKIKVQNAQFRCKLGGLRGGDELMKAVGFTRNRSSKNVDVYVYSGSVFGLLAVKKSLEEYPKLPRWVLPGHSDEEALAGDLVVGRFKSGIDNDYGEVALASGLTDGIEDQMIEEAIMRSLADARGNGDG